MENKIKFRLPEKIFIQIRNLSFKIIAYKNFISFLVNRLNEVEEEKLARYVDIFNKYSDALIQLEEEKEKLYSEIDYNFCQNVKDIPLAYNITYEIDDFNGVIEYTYEIDSNK